MSYKTPASVLFFAVLASLSACSPADLPASPTEAKQQLEALGQSVQESKASLDATVDATTAAMEDAKEKAETTAETAAAVLESTGKVVQDGLQSVTSGLESVGNTVIEATRSADD